jgi:hypothetical protein
MALTFDRINLSIFEKYKANNSKCLNSPNSRSAQYQYSFFVDTVIRWNQLPDTVSCAKSLDMALTFDRINLSISRFDLDVYTECTGSVYWISFLGICICICIEYVVVPWKRFLYNGRERCDAFVTFSKRKRQIKPKTFGDCVTINPVEQHKSNNSKCLNIHTP